MGADKTLLMRLIELNEVIEADDDGTVSESEYILFNLRKMGKVDMDTITLLREQFKTLDADGSGELDADDVGLLKQACAMIAAGTLVLPTPGAADGRTSFAGSDHGSDHGGSEGGGGGGERPISPGRANLPLLYHSPPESLTEWAPESKEPIDTFTAAASIDRLSAMYRDVAAQQLAMVDELSRLSATLNGERGGALSLTSSQRQVLQPSQRQPSQRPGGGRPPIARGADGSPGASRRTPPLSERDPARRLAFPSQQKDPNSLSERQKSPADEQEADSWTARSTFMLPAWARPTLNA